MVKVNSRNYRSRTRTRQSKRNYRSRTRTKQSKRNYRSRTRTKQSKRNYSSRQSMTGGSGKATFRYFIDVVDKRLIMLGYATEIEPEQPFEKIERSKLNVSQIPIDIGRVIGEVQANTKNLTLNMLGQSQYPGIQDTTLPTRYIELGINGIDVFHFNKKFLTILTKLNDKILAIINIKKIILFEPLTFRGLINKETNKPQYIVNINNPFKDIIEFIKNPKNDLN
jgi:hypothetical protein